MHPFLVEAIGRDRRARAVAAADRHRLVKRVRTAHGSAITSTTTATGSTGSHHKDRRPCAPPLSAPSAVPA
jgi:hypothetical protein